MVPKMCRITEGGMMKKKLNRKQYEQGGVRDRALLKFRNAMMESTRAMLMKPGDILWFNKGVGKKRGWMKKIDSKTFRFGSPGRPGQLMQKGI